MDVFDHLGLTIQIMLSDSWSMSAVSNATGLYKQGGAQWLFQFFSKAKNLWNQRLMTFRQLYEYVMENLLF